MNFSYVVLMLDCQKLQTQALTIHIELFCNQGGRSLNSYWVKNTGVSRRYLLHVARSQLYVKETAMLLSSTREEALCLVPEMFLSNKIKEMTENMEYSTADSSRWKDLWLWVYIYRYSLIILSVVSFVLAGPCISPSLPFDRTHSYQGKVIIFCYYWLCGFVCLGSVKGRYCKAATTVHVCAAICCTLTAVCFNMEQKRHNAAQMETVNTITSNETSVVIFTRIVHTITT